MFFPLLSSLIPSVSELWNLFSLFLYCKALNVVKRTQCYLLKNFKMTVSPSWITVPGGAALSQGFLWWVVGRVPRSKEKNWAPFEIKPPSSPVLRDCLTWSTHSWRISSVARQLWEVDGYRFLLSAEIFKCPEPQITHAPQVLNDLCIMTQWDYIQFITLKSPLFLLRSQC